MLNTTRKFFVILSVLLAGCAAATQERLQEENPPASDRKELTSIHQVAVGMTFKEVASIMGDEVKIGYQASKRVPGTFEPIYLKNPYQQEILRTAEEVYEVLYYFTQVKDADGIVSEDELTPVVFEKGKVIGRDWDYLKQLKARLGPTFFR